MTHQARVYWHGVFGAGLNSIASTVTVLVVDPATFNVSSAGGLAHVATVAVVSAVLGMALYIRQHPLPDPEKDEDFVQVTKARIAQATNQLVQGTGSGVSVEVESPKTVVTLEPPPPEK